MKVSFDMKLMLSVGFQRVVAGGGGSVRELNNSGLFWVVRDGLNRDRSCLS